MLGLGACLVQAANAMPDSSSCMVKGPLGSPHPHPFCRCWSTNNNMGFWWILRFPVFLAILVSPLQPLAPRLSHRHQDGYERSC